MQEILIVDGDATLGYLCGEILEREGYRVSFAVRRSEALALFRSNRYDLVLLERNLTDGDGLELGSHLRAIGVPFLVMATSAQAEERLDGFRAGAADYLSKPFHPEEMLHRVRRILPRQERRVRDRAARRQRIGEWLLNLDHQWLEADDGRRIVLTYGEFRLLAALAAANGQTVSRDRLIEIVARSEGEGHFRSVDVLISRLRKKLGDHPRRPTLIRTITNHGYRLEKRTSGQP